MLNTGLFSAPGNTHDSTLFQTATLWSNIVSEDVLSEAAAKTNDDIVIRPLIIGDGAFPIRSFLLKSYSDAVLSGKKRYFNYPARRGRMVSKGAF